MESKLEDIMYYLYKIIKPEAVTIRLLLWKNFFKENININPPTFGLNFIVQNKKVDDYFMLICGFEKFENFYVRIDILERLFIKIIESSKNNEIKLNSEMMNLLGCTKENFLKLLNLMNYKYKKIDNEIIFQISP